MIRARITAASVRQGYEWIAHAEVAPKEGLPEEISERVRTAAISRPCRRAWPGRPGWSGTCRRARSLDECAQAA